MNGLPSFIAVGSSEGRLLLLRHGAVQSAGDARRYIGRWADYFAATAPPTDVFCSDLARCLQTARKIAARCDLEPQTVLELREIDLGSWEGRSFDTIKTRFPQAFRQRGDQIADHRPPGGESFRDL